MIRSSLAGFGLLAMLSAGFAPADDPKAAADDAPRRVTRTEEEWARRLTKPQFLVCRMKETEPAFSGKYVHFKGKGTFHCVACDAPLFPTAAKFESGTGWPSFWRPISPQRIASALDNSAPEQRIEVMCASCDSHLGHVFNDGPPPTGLRYCINSISIKFVKDGEKKVEPTKSGDKKAEPAPSGGASEPSQESKPRTGRVVEFR